MMIKRFTVIILTLIISYPAISQDKDFGIWYGTSVRLGITSKISSFASASIHTYQNATKTEDKYIEAGIDYNINKYFSTSGSYRFSRTIENDYRFHTQHKLYFDLRGNIKFSYFTFEGRLRFQDKYRTYFETNEDKIPDYGARFRLRVTYRKASLPLNPYIYVESFVPLNKEPEELINKNRFFTGIEYSISHKQSIDAGYLFQRTNFPNRSDLNTITVSYRLDFR